MFEIFRQARQKLVVCAECELHAHRTNSDMFFDHIAKQQIWRKILIFFKLQEEILLFILLRRRWRRRYKHIVERHGQKDES